MYKDDINYIITIGELKNKKVSELKGLLMKNIVKPIKQVNIKSIINCTKTDIELTVTHEMLNKRLAFDLDGLIIEKMLVPYKSSNLNASNLKLIKADKSIKTNIIINIKSNNKINI